MGRVMAFCGPLLHQKLFVHQTQSAEVGSLFCYPYGAESVRAKSDRQ
jgi:hypothetical protein